MTGPARPLHVHAMIDSLGFGGAEMLLSDFAVGARASGMELTVGYLVERSGSPAAARLRAHGADPALVPITRLLGPSDLRRVRGHLSAVRPDVVHTHLGYADTMAGAMARSLGIPTVSTIHVMEWEDTRRDVTKRRLAGAVRRRCAARVITVSDEARRCFLATGDDSPERVVTVHNGVAGVARPGEGREVRAQLGIGAEDLVAAMVSVLRPGKGHELAIAAVAALRRRFPRLRLLVLGEGPSRTAIEGLAAGLGDVVVMAGHREDVMATLDGVDLLLHPSRVDAFPTSLLEAMAAGVPVIAGAVGGIPEIVEPGVTGLLLAPPPRADDLETALGGLLEDPARRRRLGEQARRRFEELFTAERWAQRTREVYEVALAERRRPGPRVT